MKGFFISISCIFVVLAFTIFGILVINKDKEISDLKTENQLLSKEYEETKLYLSSLLEQKTSAINALNVKIDEYNQLRIERDSILENISVLNSTISSKDAEIQQLRRNISELEVELEELKSNGGDISIIEELERIISEKQSEIEILNSEKEDLNTQISTLQIENSELTSSIDQKEMEIESLQNQIDEMHDYYMDMVQQESESIRQEYHEQMMELEMKYDGLKGELAVFKEIYEGTATSIGWYSFKDVTKIRDYAFYGCTDLQIVDIPETIESIGEYAFVNVGYHNFNIHIYNSVPPTITETTFDSTKSFTVMCLRGYKEAFENAPIWKDLNITVLDYLDPIPWDEVD